MTSLRDILVRHKPGQTLQATDMRVELIELFHVHEDSTGYVRWITEKPEDAATLAEGLGEHGHPGRVEKVVYARIYCAAGSALVPLTSLDSRPLETRLAEASTRASALRKLTPDERRALGIR